MNNLCCEFYFSQLLMACWVPSCYAVSAYVFTAWLKQKERKYSHIFFLFFCLILTEVSSDLFFLWLKLWLCLHSGCLPGWASGRSMCRTGVGRTWPPLPTAAYAGCLVSQATLVSVRTWRNRKCRVWEPTRAPQMPMVSSVKRLQVSLLYDGVWLSVSSI